MARGAAARMLGITPKSVTRLCAKGVLTKNISPRFIDEDSVLAYMKIQKRRHKPSTHQKKLSFAKADRTEVRKALKTGIIKGAAVLFEKHSYLISIQQRIKTFATVDSPAWQAIASKAKKNFTGYDQTVRQADTPMEALRLLVTYLCRKHKIEN